MSAVALTFAIDVLGIYEQEYPMDNIPHSTLEFCTSWMINDTSRSLIIRTFVSYDMNEICSKKIHSINQCAYAAAKTIMNAFYISTFESPYNITEFYNLIEDAAYAKRDTNVEQYAHNILFSILPLILEYKIEHQESFGEPELIWEYLTPDQKDLVIFNLDFFSKGDPND